MSTNSVAAISATSMASLEDVHNFLKQKSESGELPANTARNRSSALKHISGVLQPDEARDADSIHELLDDLVDRFATLHPATRPDTVKMYGTRARSALRDFIAWRQDPTGFKFRRRKPKQKKASLPISGTSQEQPAPSNDVPAAAFAESDRGELHRGSIPIGDAGDFAFTFPRGAMSMREVRRIAIMLAAYADDFDTDAPTNAQVFGIQRPND